MPEIPMVLLVLSGMIFSIPGTKKASKIMLIKNNTNRSSLIPLNVSY